MNRAWLKINVVAVILLALALFPILAWADGPEYTTEEILRLIEINGGPILPRIRFQSMGRVFRVRKRTCHLMVRISDEGRAERREAAAKKRRKKTVRKERSSEE